MKVSEYNIFFTQTYQFWKYPVPSDAEEAVEYASKLLEFGCQWLSTESMAQDDITTMYDV